MLRRFACIIICVSGLYSLSVITTGCAQIGMPTGGPKDTLIPILVKADPPDNSTNVKTNRITFTFNEYIDIQELQNNLLVSPLQKNNPVISFNFRNITVRFRDTLLPNTTYNISFGNAVRDLNEGNILRDFSYTFSTGDIIDSLQLQGKVILAETGGIDSTMFATLYRNLDDSAVQTIKPMYMARIRNDGSFRFTNLPSNIYNVYALKDGDGSRTYNSPTEMFAFLNTAVSIPQNADSLILYAYEEEKKVERATSVLPAKTLSYTTVISQGAQDLLTPLEIVFNNAIDTVDSTKLVIVDSAFNPITTRYELDSTQKKLSLFVNWQKEAPYSLIIAADAVKDTIGNVLVKSDTLTFFAKRTEDYGTLLLRFTNLDLSANPVLQFVERGEIRFSYPLTSREWRSTLFQPGEYELRILSDENGNGKWDPGSYKEKRQPERAVTLKQKITVRPNWDNELDIEL